MLMGSNCVVCILNQILRVSAYLKLEKEEVERVFRKVLSAAGEIDYQHLPAPKYAERMYAIFTRAIGNPDPYKLLRKEQNDFVLTHRDLFFRNINHSENPLQTAAFYSLIGNIIDFGSESLFDHNDVFDQVERFIPDINDYPEFEEKLKRCSQLLVIADNAGEAVFDLFLLQQIKRIYPGLNIFYAVRSKPAINDILEEDARYIGIPEYATVIPSGSSCAGTIISECTEDFVKIFHDSDLIISKGQGNFETLENTRPEVLFIFKTKCRLVEQYLGLKPGCLIFSFDGNLNKQNL